MFTITATMQTETVTLKDDTLKQMVKYMDAQHLEFSKAALKVRRKSIFEILIQLIRFTPVDTGRLRGSWTPYLDRWGKQASYARFLSDKSLAKSKPKTLMGRAKAAAQKLLNLDQVSAGKREGFFTEGEGVTTIGTNVAYAYAVNQQSQYFDLASINANRILNKNAEEFLKAAAAAGWIPTDFSDEPRPSN